LSASGPRSRGARAHPRPCQGVQPRLRPSAASGLVLATQSLDSTTGRSIMAKLEFAHVSKTFGDFYAVHDLNIEVAEGEFVVLVGPSGCGKTTALRMVAGLEEVSEGEIRIGDRVVNEVAPKDRDIAMVFQNYALYPHMSVFENMAFGLKLRRVKRPEVKEKVEDTARFLELFDLLTRKPGQLSGGQRQRVAMGRAIVREPKAFLMDEPLS